MATKIVTKNSSTASAVPTASDLVQGELAVNVADKRLFTEDNGGSIVELGTNPSTIDINAGTIDGTTIGASSASTGAFTTLTATGAFTSVGIDDNATSTAITIDSSENVGIGTSGPTGNLEIATSASDTGVDVVLDGNKTSNGGIGSIIFNNNGDSVGMIRSNRASANDAADMLFYTQATGGTNTERMRIDSSGNVLVGTTSTDPAASSTETGVALKGGGFVSISRNDSAASVNINKVFYDGSIVDFRKDGISVGTIGVGNSNDLTIGTADTGLVFQDNERISPWNPSTNSLRDAAIDFGDSDRRFKDLYLSGGAYLGGTGSANKLDDYEEGTWTPTSTTTGVTIGSQSCRYTKVGRLVTLTGSITFSALPSNISTMSLSGAPFTCWAQHTAGIVREVTTVGAIYVLQINANSTSFGMNSYSGVANGSARIFAINEGYNFSLTYTV